MTSKGANGTLQFGTKVHHCLAPQSGELAPQSRVLLAVRTAPPHMPCEPAFRTGPLALPASALWATSPPLTAYPSRPAPLPALRPSLLLFYLICTLTLHRVWCPSLSHTLDSKFPAGKHVAQFIFTGSMEYGHTKYSVSPAIH